MKAKLAQICQVCGHEEDLEECPQCSRYTCQPCFNDINEQGVEGKSCLYCGHVWFMPEKPAAKVLESGNLSTTIRGDSYNRAFGVALQEEHRFTQPMEDHRVDLTQYSPDRHTDINPGDVVTVDESGDVEPYHISALDDPARVIGELSDVVGIAGMNIDPLSLHYNNVEIRLTTSDGEPFDLTEATVMWGEREGQITDPLVGLVTFIEGINNALNRSDVPITIRKDGILYSINVGDQFSSLQARLPEPDEARRLIRTRSERPSISALRPQFGRYEWDTIHEKLKGKAWTRKQIKAGIFEAKDVPLGTLNKWLNEKVAQQYALKKSQAYHGQDLFYFMTDDEFAAGNVREEWPPPPTTEAYRTIGGERFDWELAFVKFMVSIGGLGVLLILIGLFGL